MPGGMGGISNAYLINALNNNAILLAYLMIRRINIHYY